MDYYNHQPPYPPQMQIEQRGRALGVASFVLSLIALSSFIVLVMYTDAALWFLIAGLICSITGLVLGAASRKKLHNGNGLGMAGFIISIITLVLFVIVILLVLALFFFFADVLHALSGPGSIG